MLRSLALLTLALAPAIAHADNGTCEFEDGGFERPDTTGACAEATSVPLGCPIYFVIGHGLTPAAPTVNGSDASATAAETFVATVALPGEAVDVPDSDCACDPAAISSSEDEYTLTLTGLQVGDVVSLGMDPDADVEQTQVVVTAAATCPAAAWPTTLDAHAACDRCPGSDGSGSDGSAGSAGSGSNGSAGSAGSADGDGGGCSAEPRGGAPVAGLVLALAALGAGVRRRRLAPRRA